MTTQPTAMRLADWLINGQPYNAAPEAAAELIRLHEVLQSISVIAHCGGLTGMSEGDALTEIRKISLPYWNKDSSIEQDRAAIAKATSQ